MQTLKDERSNFNSTSSSSPSEQDVKSIKDKASNACDVLLTTDAPLIFTPGQIALAALRSGMQKVIPESSLEKRSHFPVLLPCLHSKQNSLKSYRLLTSTCKPSYL